MTWEVLCKCSGNVLIDIYFNLKITSLLMLSLHLMLGLPAGLIPSGIPVSSPLIILSFSILAMCPAHLSLLRSYMTSYRWQP